VTALPTDKIFATLWFMKKEAYAETTTEAVSKRLKHLAKNCFLGDPESAKAFVAQKKCSMAFKESLVEAYDLYCGANGLVWRKPFYVRYDKMPRIPTEEKLNMIIANASQVCIDTFYDERLGNQASRAYVAESKRRRLGNRRSKHHKR